MYSCTVITTESESNMSQVHNRVPVFLDESADVEVSLSLLLFYLGGIIIYVNVTL